MKKSIIAAAVFAASFAAQALESTIAYQGILRNDQGAVLSGTQYVISFRLYKQASGGTAIWGRSSAVLLDENGLFNVELSDAIGSDVGGAQFTNLSDALADARGGNLFIGLTVEGSSGEISPRQKIMTVPYATYAADVSQASGDFAVAGKTTLNDTSATSLSVSGGATFGGPVRFSQGVTVNGNLNVTENGAITGRGTAPLGAIVIWSGAIDEIPSGWALCDGANGTPDLSDRFVMGSSENLGVKGGASSVTLKVENIPPHSHLYFGDDQLEGMDTTYGTTTKKADMYGYDADSKKSGNSKVYYTSTTGGENNAAKSFSILPPYIKLAYIMRIR